MCGWVGTIRHTPTHKQPQTKHRVVPNVSESPSMICITNGGNAGNLDSTSHAGQEESALEHFAIVVYAYLHYVRWPPVQISFGGASVLAWLLLRTAGPFCDPHARMHKVRLALRMICF